MKKEKRKEWYGTIKGRLKHFVYQCRYRSKKMGLSTDIDLPFLQSLWDSQNASCVLTGIPFEMVAGRSPYAPSLDRIDSKGGYTKDNVRLIVYVLNITLNEFGTEAFEVVSKGYWIKKTKQGSTFL